MILVCAAGLPAGTAARAEEPVSAMAGDYITFLGHVGGSPLSSDEAQRIASVVQAGARSNPAGWTREHGYIITALKIFASGNSYAIAMSRENHRRDLAATPADNPMRQVIERHDPTIAWLPGPRLLVTVASLRALTQAASWARAYAGVPAQADLGASEQARLGRDFASFSPALQDAYDHAGRNYAAANAFMATIVPDQRRAYFRAHAVERPLADDPADATALLVQGLYNEVLRRHESPIALSMRSGPATEAAIMRTQWDTLRMLMDRTP